MTCGGSVAASTGLPMIAPRRAIGVPSLAVSVIEGGVGGEPDDRDHQQDDADPRPADDPAANAAPPRWSRDGVARVGIGFAKCCGLFAGAFTLVALAQAFALGDQAFAFIGIGFALAASAVAGTVCIEGIGAHRVVPAVGHLVCYRSITVRTSLCACLSCMQAERQRRGIATRAPRRWAVVIVPRNGEEQAKRSNRVIT
jgi:hypothetical protein